ncbi:uncharacterized protein ACN2A1_014579 isoform 1-T4 [Glossina fuscipes fuscipes]
MTPEPPDKNPNRFYLLSDTSPQRKKSKKSDFPVLPISDIIPIDKKYIVISSTDARITISQISPFAIKKALDSITTYIDSISILRDGNLLVLAGNPRATEKLIKANSLANLCAISAKLHEKLNSVRGVIYAPCLKHVPEDEIVREMGIQGVTEAYKLTKLNDDGKTRSPTGRIILTFDRYRLPRTVDVAWYKCKVELYIPNPMRCKNCQRLGHTAKRCTNAASCANCGHPPHTVSCTRSFCINCNDQHSALDKQCPRFVQMREILKIKTENYCSMGEARRTYRERNPSVAHGIGKSNTYAAVASQIEPSKTLTATASNEKPVPPLTKNYIAKPVTSLAKDNIEKTKATANIEKIQTTTYMLKSNIPNSPESHFTQHITSGNESILSSINQPLKTKATANIEKIKTTTHLLKSNIPNSPESPALNFNQQITSVNESILSSLNQPSISNYSRAPTRCVSNVPNHLNTDYSAGKNKSFTKNSYSDLLDGDADMST